MVAALGLPVRRRQCAVDTSSAPCQSLCVCCATQAAFVASAPSLGVDVNWDAALWGPLYGTAFASLLYGLAVLFTVDWQAVAGAAWRVYAWFGGLVLSFFDRFVWKYEWAEAPRRR